MIPFVFRMIDVFSKKLRLVKLNKWNKWYIEYYKNI